MEIYAIQSLLKANEAELIKFLYAQNPLFWDKKPDGKWSVGQHIIHLVQSTKPLANALLLPNFMLKWKFGTSTRPSRTYQDTTKRYLEKLEKSRDLVSKFSANMPITSASENKMWLDRFSKLNDLLNHRINTLSPKELDTIILPHPLMGKMTLREILMWNTYHTLHHLNVLKSNYL